MSWFKKGNEAFDKDNFNSGKQNKPFEFYLKVGRENGKEFIFLDDPKIGFNQHTFKMGENQFETFTCLGEECPACAKGYYTSYVMPFTIFELTPFVSKKTNTEVPGSKKAFIAKGKTVVEVLNERRANTQDQSLKGKKLKVIRTDDKATACGNDFQVLGPADLKKMEDKLKEFQIDLTPIDYETVYAPVTVKQMENKMKYAAPPQNNKSKTKTVSKSDFNMDDFGPEPSFNQSEDIPF